MRSRETIVRQLELYRDSCEMDEAARLSWIAALQWVLELTPDAPPDEKLAALQQAANHFDSDITQIVCSDERGNLTAFGCYARGANAKILKLFTERLS